ncbi:hypothetical protein Tco_0706894 [Tanacetum coccineum]|uniref:Uncharacterized protein n=1 Tax=Tanacetum coccineum TaxID=301880 RepID=A0ABQ4Y8Q1_9ASTR
MGMCCGWSIEWCGRMADLGGWMWCGVLDVVVWMDEYRALVSGPICESEDSLTETGERSLLALFVQSSL